MAFCSECGFKNPDDARFCGNCGKPLSQPSYQPSAQPTPAHQPAPTPQPAAAPPTVQPAPAYQAPPTQPATPPKSGGGGKSCLGCGCTFLIVAAIIIGICCWAGYEYIKNHEEDFSELLELFGAETYNMEEAEKATYKGQLVKDIAAEQGFPFVAYNERPTELLLYLNKAIDMKAQFYYLKYHDSESMGTMTLTTTTPPIEVLYFKMVSCGSSIYHIINTQDTSMDGYIFVYKGAKRILIGRDGDLKEFALNEDDED